MTKTSILLTMLVFGLANSMLSQSILPGFRGWVFSSTPPNQTLGTSSMLETNFNRGHLSWYVIDHSFYFRNLPTSFPESDLSDHYSRQITPNEVFPRRTNLTGDNLLRTFNLRYNPDEPGPYNFDVLPTNTSAGIDSEGKLLAPETRWAGIMRRFADPDLPAQGIDSIEFWLLDPFLYNSGHSGFTLTFQVGDVSEDVLMDNIRVYEQGLSQGIDSTVWGRYSLLPMGSPEFPEDDELRSRLDVGLDGLSDDAERLWFKTEYLDRIENAFGSNSNAYQEAWEDPSRDNFSYFDGPSLDNVSVPERYARINGMEGNSAILEPFTGSNGYTSHPDMEDLNLNETLDTYESTEDYALRIKPRMAEAASFIVDSTQSEVRLINGEVEAVTWYHFKFPLVKDGSNLSLDDFRNVSGLRLVLSDCSEPVTLRFVDSQVLNFCEVYPLGLTLEEPKATPFPNPFNEELQFSLENKGEWPSRLQLWDTRGRKVEDYSDFRFDASYFPGENLIPGVYLYRLNTTNNITGRSAVYSGRVLKRR